MTGTEVFNKVMEARQKYLAPIEIDGVRYSTEYEPDDLHDDWNEVDTVPVHHL